MNMMDNAIHNDDLTIEAVKHGVDDAANRNEPDAMAINEPISDVNGDVLRPIDAEPLMGTFKCNGQLVGIPQQTQQQAYDAVLQLKVAGIIKAGTIGRSTYTMDITAMYTSSGESVKWSWRAN